MHNHSHAHQTELIIEKAKDLGSSLAGIGAVSSLRDSPSYAVYDSRPYYERYSAARWPVDARSILVLALLHDPSKPELDYWRNDLPGKTLGNWQLMKIAAALREWFLSDLQIKATPLSYYVEDGGVLLKDAAVLAGLGIIGKNNLLITPEYGPRVRLRALFLDVELAATGQVEFNPCEGCPAPCHMACPQDAFRSGLYSRDLCDLQMSADEEAQEILGTQEEQDATRFSRKYCRECELACPIPYA